MTEGSEPIPRTGPLRAGATARQGSAGQAVRISALENPASRAQETPGDSGDRAA